MGIISSKAPRKNWEKSQLHYLMSTTKGHVLWIGKANGTNLSGSQKMKSYKKPSHCLEIMNLEKSTQCDIAITILRLPSWGSYHEIIIRCILSIQGVETVHYMIIRSITWRRRRSWATNCILSHRRGCSLSKTAWIWRFSAAEWSCTIHRWGKRNPVYSLPPGRTNLATEK